MKGQTRVCLAAGAHDPSVIVVRGAVLNHARVVVPLMVCVVTKSTRNNSASERVHVRAPIGMQGWRSTLQQCNPPPLDAAG